MTEPTRERLALDRLLALFPTFDVLRVDWQLSPWLLVELGQRSDDGAEAWARHCFAIWKLTGATHGIDTYGAVIDPPFLEGMADKG
jgi:hypothetical protein